MKLKVIGTGSSGNCYIVQAGRSNLMLDAGMRMQDIRRSMPRPSSIAGCLVTHEHMDHAKSAYDIAALGIPVVMSNGTFEAIEKEHSPIRFKLACELIPITLGDFTVLPFKTQHDAREPLGFLIRHNPTNETILYATDTFYLAYTFPGVNYWIVECNYVDEIINQKADDGELSSSLRNRLRRSHMSLRRLKDALMANELTKTRSIILIHLSDQRSDEDVMVESIKETTGIENVVAALPGMEIPLEINPF